MLERNSALATAHPYASSVLRIEEAPDFSLTQVSGDEKELAGLLGPLPPSVGSAADNKGRAILRIGPRQFWVIAAADDDVARTLRGAVKVVPLSSSRTRILLEGAAARAVLAKGMAIDFHPSVFAVGHFVQTGVHHTPVTVHCIAEDAFHIYAMRSFAMSVWHWITDAALEFTN